MERGVLAMAAKFSLGEVTHDSAVFGPCSPPRPGVRYADMTDIPPPDDVLEQHQEVVPEEQDDLPTSDPEAPEADALEQAQVVPDDDEDEMR
jgi:hypothetical protein